MDMGLVDGAVRMSQRQLAVVVDRMLHSTVV